jgi:glycosyltransferase involved in cell wall biosynthesis
MTFEDPSSACYNSLQVSTTRNNIVEMVVHLYCPCRNEAKILPFFFRHYDPFVDAYTVFDDGSTDGSLDILHAHPKVEVRSFPKAHPDSVVLSHLYIANRCWKESRGSADWVILVDLDEHLFHPQMTKYLWNCKTAGVTIVPALGFQMYAPQFPEPLETLCETKPLGVPDLDMSKLAVFRPDAIDEIFLAPGRHWACPTGDVIAPAVDELSLLHYKCLGVEYVLQRHGALKLGLGKLDIARGWGDQYFWSEEELRGEVNKSTRQAKDLLHSYDVSLEEYPQPRWWEKFRGRCHRAKEPVSSAVPALNTPARGSRRSDPPRVSVILPSYNHERFLASTLDSILVQTYQDFEIVITDDGSTDRSVDLLRDYERRDSRIKLFVNRVNYESHSLNKCVREAIGDYIAVAHSDDEFAPTKLEEQVRFLDEHPEVAVVFAAPRIINEFGEELENYNVFDGKNQSRHEWLRRFFLWGNSLCHPSALIRRSVYDRLGLYNPLFGALDDFDMWVRTCLYFDIHVLPDRLVNFRIHDWASNTSGDKPENFRRAQYEFVKILDHFQSPEALAQLHLIFPDVADRILDKSEAVKRYVLAMLALDTGHLCHRYWAIDLLYCLLANPETKLQLAELLGATPEGDFVKMNGSMNPFTVERRPSVTVFWPVSGDYSKLNSCSAYYTAGAWTELRIPVPAWDTSMPLRIDPCDFACVVNLSEAGILARTDGRCLWRTRLKEVGAGVALSGAAVLLPNQNLMSILCTGDNPQIYLGNIPRLPDIPLQLQLWIKLDTGLDRVGQELERLRMCTPTSVSPALTTATASTDEALRIDAHRDTLAMLRFSVAEVEKLTNSSAEDSRAPDETSGPLLRRADELLAEVQSAQATLSRTWYGRQILQSGRAALQKKNSSTEDSRAPDDTTGPLLRRADES